MKPIRVAFVFEYPTLNGGELSLFAFLEKMPLERFVPTLLGPETGVLRDACHQRGWNYLPVNLQLLKSSPDDLVRQLNQIIREKKLDLIHSNSLSAGRKIGSIARQLDCQTTSHVRDIIKLSRQAIVDLQENQKLIAVSDATRDFHLKQGFAPSKIQRIHNGIDLQRHAPRPSLGWLKEKLGLPAEARLIANVGQICLRKGQLDFARAAVKVGQSRPDLHFLLIGERHSSKEESLQYDLELDEIFLEGGLKNQFHRLGWVPEMSQVYPEIDLLVHTAYQEPLGRVLLEASAYAIPIVATAVGGTTEILKDGFSARLVDPGNVEQLSQAMRASLEDESDSQRMADRARIWAEHNFSIEQNCLQTEQFWRTLILENNDNVTF